jgi:hypothetical protein
VVAHASSGDWLDDLALGDHRSGIRSTQCSEDLRRPAERQIS